MGLIINEIIDRKDRLAIWHVTEPLDKLTESYFNQSDKAADLTTFSNIKLDKIKKQWLATRLALREISSIDADIVYDEHGAPWIEIDDWELSISHSADWVAVLLSKSSLIGVDLQSYNSKITNIAKKFTNTEEYNLWLENGNTDYLHALWTVKESVYKAFKHTQPFKKIKVFPRWPLTSSLIDCKVERGNKTYQFKVNHRKFDEFYLSYVRL